MPEGVTTYLMLAKLCAAAYQPWADASATVQALGFEWVDAVGDDGCSAIVVRANGESIIAFQGTELDPGHWREVIDDLDCVTTTVHSKGGPLLLHEGFYKPLAALWPAVAPLVGPGHFVAVGHSLGGARANLAPLLAASPAAVQVVTFGAPRISITPWLHPTVRFINAADPVPDIPIGFHHTTEDFMWLKDGHVEFTTSRGMFNFDIEDHGIDQYIAALA